MPAPTITLDATWGNATATLDANATDARGSFAVQTSDKPSGEMYGAGLKLTFGTAFTSAPYTFLTLANPFKAEVISYLVLPAYISIIYKSVPPWGGLKFTFYYQTIATGG